MMKRHFLFALLFTGFQLLAQAQQDSTSLKGASADDIEALFSDLEMLLDSVSKPQSFGSFSLMAGNRLLNVQSQSGQATTNQALMLSPSAGYYHKSGLGIGGSVNFFSRQGQISPSLYLATLSYDYLKIPGVMTGVAYSRFSRPDSLDFYTTPLKNEVSVYGMYRKSWLKPALSVSYGWGSREEVREQQTIVTALRKKKKKKNQTIEVPGTTITHSTESVSDWMVSFSARHDFYFFNVLAKRDNFRFTPQLAVNAGTQRYGFNQNSSTYLVKRSDTNSKPFMSDQVNLQDVSKWQPLSVTAFLRTAYSKGKFFVQPQVIFDYYLPTADHNLSTSFAVNSGIIF